MESSEGAPRSHPGRGRGRGRGGSSDGRNGTRGNQNEMRASGRGRGRGRGRGGANRGRASQHGYSDTEGTTPLSETTLSTTPAPTQNGQGVTPGVAVEDEVEAEVCFICASPIDHQSVAPCNHRTCHVCALRLRALYKTKACAHCRTEAAVVIFTDDGEKRYEDYNMDTMARRDDNLGIAFEKDTIWEDTIVLLRYNCPDPSCDVACLGWPDLHRHVKHVHHKVMCDLCTRNKKVFTHEHELFTPQDLRRHERHGDDNPGAVDQSGFKGHPECGFCRQRFYGDDELFTHCRDKHERCHLCDRRTGGNNPRYFVDYNSLEAHFGKEHYPCLDRECQEKKFVVFDSEMDLKAHQLEAHPNGLSKDARRDARRVDISAFNYRSDYQEERAQRGGRRGGRGRDPNAGGLPPASAGHMTRAEIAHQRAREIQSAQSVSSRTFGGQLTQPDPPSQTVHRPPQSPRPNDVQPASELPTLTQEALTPQEQARRLRHAAVTERASQLLRNDQTKLAEFRNRVSSFKNGAITAPALIETFFSLFDTSSTDLGKLIRELAEIFELPEKRSALLGAWNDWKAINEDYPSLPGPSGASASTAAGILGQGIGGSRILKLKSSTAQSSRSAAGQGHTWAATGRAKPSGPAFPSLPLAANGASKSTGSSSGWLALRPSGSSSTSARSSATPSRNASSQNLPKTDAFPALPAAAKPTSTVFSPGYRGAGVLRVNSSSAVNAWQNGGAVSPPETGPETEQSKKKGRKGKQVLVQWG